MTALAKFNLGTMLLVGNASGAAEFLEVVDLDVAGEIVCLYCGGSGAFAEPGEDRGPCVTCKATGRVLVSI